MQPKGPVCSVGTVSAAHLPLLIVGIGLKQLPRENRIMSNLEVSPYLLRMSPRE